MPSSRRTKKELRQQQGRNPCRSRRQNVATEKAKLALEIAILEAELERKRIRHAIQTISRQMHSPNCISSRKSKAKQSNTAKAAMSHLAGTSKPLPIETMPMAHNTASITVLDESETTATSETSWSSSNRNGNHNHTTPSSISVEKSSLHHARRNSQSSVLMKEITVTKPLAEVYKDEENAIQDNASFYYYEETTIVEETHDDNESCKSSYEEYTIHEGDDEQNSYEEHTIVEDDRDDIASYFEELTIHSQDYCYDNGDASDDDDDKANIHSLPQDGQILHQWTSPGLQTLMEEDDEGGAEDTAKDETLSSWGTTVFDPYDTEYRRRVYAEAASLGRLTRLEELIIATIADNKASSSRPCDSWKPVGLLALSRSLGRQCNRPVLHEFSQKGTNTVLPEQRRTPTRKQYDVCDDEEEEEEELTIDQVFTHPDSNATIEIPRQQSVKDLGALFESSGSLGTFEDSALSIGGLRTGQKPEVSLPVPTLPTIRSKAVAASVTRFDLAQAAATVAWDRLCKTRQAFKVRQACTCPYCPTACPQQTLAYQLLMSSAK